MNIIRPYNEAGKGLPVCVTGAGGYIGSWLVKTLLENGYTVNATLRDPGNPSKNSFLLSLPAANERLRLFRADLCEEGSFDSAIRGCQGVFHTASPTDSDSQDPEKELTEAAVRGTMNVLKSCATSESVRRVVYTSSASASFFLEKPVEIIDESCWSSVDFIRQNKPPGWMYYVSKTLAEQAAMQFAKENRMEVVSILPVIVAGPWLTTGVPASVDVTLSLITGNRNLHEILKWIGPSFVHIEDLCRAHLFLMEEAAVDTFAPPTAPLYQNSQISFVSVVQSTRYPSSWTMQSRTIFSHVLCRSRNYWIWDLLTDMIWVTSLTKPYNILITSAYRSSNFCYRENSINYCMYWLKRDQK